MRTLAATVVGCIALGAVLNAPAWPFVIGGLVNQIWTIKDNADRPRVNSFMLQLNFLFPGKK